MSEARSPNLKSVSPPLQITKEGRSKIEVSKTEIIDRGKEGKFIFAPHAVRHHIYTYLGIDYLFPERYLDVDEAGLRSDYDRRQVKNYNTIPVLTAILRIDEIKQELDEYGYGDLDESQRKELRNFIQIVENEQHLLKEKFGAEGVPTEVAAEELTLILNSPGLAFAYHDGEEVFGFISKSASIRADLFGKHIDVHGRIHASFGEGISAIIYNFKIPYFEGYKSLKEIGISMLSSDKKTFDYLVQRGKKYVDLVSKPSYRHYSGTIARRSWWTTHKFKADGRVMVDIAAMRNIDPDYNAYFGWRRFEPSDQNRPNGLTEFTNEQYISMPPYVYGFSFTSKVWGEMTVDSISDIVFREDAYDMLVMDEDRKSMIFALVDNSISGAKDFIDGKGGGCIFLLAGPPGGGKTLTAEAIAERLKRPLYMVGVGELGTDVQSLEESLRKILDVATTWNAVLLIDECDIFMEERTDMDVHRNAMVGVFLRLLEYYEGVLFLTTNRAKNIDKAFYSRISMALHYAPLKTDDRKIVWSNLLKIYGIEGIDVDTLAKHELNGRKIKGVIRIAKALAAAENRNPELRDFERVIEREQEFKEAVGYDI